MNGDGFASALRDPAGDVHWLVPADGPSRRLPVERWHRQATAAEATVVARCAGAGAWQGQAHVETGRHRRTPFRRAWLDPDAMSGVAVAARSPMTTGRSTRTSCGWPVAPAGPGSASSPPPRGAGRGSDAGTPDCNNGGCYAGLYRTCGAADAQWIPIDLDHPGAAGDRYRYVTTMTPQPGRPLRYVTEFRNPTSYLG